MNAACALHPTVPAAEVCTRCGAFLCTGDVRRLDRKIYCPTCVALPEVDYVEAYRQSMLGRRDGWAWLFGLVGLLQVVGALAAFVSPTRSWPGALGLLAMGAVGVCFWLGLKWTRYALLAVEVASLVLVAATAPQAAGLPLITLLVGLAIFFDTRNQLFFRLDVPRPRVEKMWRLHKDNPIARTGIFAAFFGLVVPGLSVVAAVLCAIGLARVDANAHPPVGRRGQAIWGLVISSLGILFWGGLLVRALLEP